MGKQSARLYYKGKDHKDIFFQNHYHSKMYKGSELVWEKILGNEYIVFQFKNEIKVLDIENKQIYKDTRNYLRVMLNTENIILTDIDSYLHNDGLFISKNGTHYMYKLDWNEPYGYWTTTYYYASNNVLYVLKSDFSTGTSKTHYKMYSFLVDENEDITADYDVFEQDISKNLYIWNGGISVKTYNSSKIPFFIYRDSRTEQTTFYYVENNVVNTIDLNIPGFATGRINIFFCVNNVFYIIYQNKAYGDKYNVYAYDFDNSIGQIYANVFEFSYENHMNISSWFYLNNKAYMYVLFKNGELHCYETSDFKNFKKTVCNRNFSIKYVDGRMVEFDGYEGFSFTVPCNAHSCGYFINNKMTQKECMVLFPSQGGAVFMDNMYFNESEGNFGTIL